MSTKQRDITIEFTDGVVVKFEDIYDVHQTPVALSVAVTRQEERVYTWPFIRAITVEEVTKLTK